MGGVAVGSSWADDSEAPATEGTPACCQAKSAEQGESAKSEVCAGCGKEGKEAHAGVSCLTDGAGESAETHQGHAQGERPGRGGYGQGHGGPPAELQDMHDTIHSLLDNHEKIERTVKHIPGGVLTETTSKDSAVMATLIKHVMQVKLRLESGKPIRYWDPLFVEIFKNYKKIKMEVEPIEGGVRVTETSDDPQVTLLIRQHAEKGISEFIKYGIERAQKASELPKGYKRDH